MFIYGKLKMTMVQNVGELTNKANRTFDDRIWKLNDIGENNAAKNMKEEKGKFYRAVERIKYMKHSRE